ncbi:alpha-glucosidase C-terminal domain-containing protein [Deinococcus radiophilus]|uniref:Maltogenic amylase-like C-terminal domain-containing protein n=1 Tax=Deinococcus radiophilus TaxID=32062 RepID=A0A431VN87_9DEIO|nr:alpha-glucosidase C-terminal domain-containing protein [Deinococcus radiophilus]RTR23826.1 hypothetical protein EJ104_12400 [Deinococcus radiophilus]UFA50459.1 alpha-glucosidase C-terminal domain-containing protein [Deinococcus radiophilus]
MLIQRLQPLDAQGEQGEIRPLLEGHPQLLAYERRLERERALIVCNFSAETVPVPLALLEGDTLVIGNYPDPPQRGPAQDLTLRPYEAVVYCCG